jgi:hypothetical protein
MSLIEFCSYLKQEIYDLQTQLKTALEQRDLYERLLREDDDEPMLPASPLPTPTPLSYWEWLRSLPSGAKTEHKV